MGIQCTPTCTYAATQVHMWRNVQYKWKENQSKDIESKNRAANNRRSLFDQNLLVSDEIPPVCEHHIQRSYILLRQGRTKIYLNIKYIKFNLFSVMSDQNLVLSDQDGFLIGHMFFHKRKTYYLRPCKKLKMVHLNSPYAWLRQTSKFHQQASFVNKIFCICTFCAWVFFSTLLPWEFISVKLRLFLISKRGLVVKFACVT